MALLPPRASLLGLPVELRQQIYGHLSNNLHVHYTSPWGTDPSNLLCLNPDPEFPQLCARPVWTGTYQGQDVCNPRRASGDPAYNARILEAIRLRRGRMFAVRLTCKSIYFETESILAANTGRNVTSISVYGWAVHNVLENIGRANLVKIRRITLERNCFVFKPMEPALEWFKKNQSACLPNLQVLALQGIIQMRKFEVRRQPKQVTFAPERWHDLAVVREFEEILSPRVTIIVETWSCLGPGQTLYEGGGEECEMLIIRGVIFGQAGTNGIRKRTPYSVRREEVVNYGGLILEWQCCDFAFGKPLSWQRGRN